MDYDNMRVMELKALMRTCGLRGYSQMRKDGLIGLLQNDPPAPWRTPTKQEMDIFEQQEMSKSRPQVKNKLNDWYNWLINHVPKPIKMVQVKHLKLLRIRLWGCIIGLLVPLVIGPNGGPWALLRRVENPNHLNQ